MDSRIKQVDFSNKRDIDYMHGVICGDGYVGDGKISICTGREDEDDNAVMISNIIEDSFGLNATITSGGGNSLYVRVSSVTLADYYRPRKYPMWDVSGVTHPEEFISGIIDTDGSIPSRLKELLIVQVSNDSCIKIMKMLNSLAVSGASLNRYTSSSGYNKGRDYHRIRVEHRDDILSLNELINLRNPRKRERFANLVKVKECSKSYKRRQLR